MLILATVSVTVAIQGGLFDKANEAKILTIIAQLKEEIEEDKVIKYLKDETTTVEALLAEGKIKRVVKEEEEGTYYLYYAIKENAYRTMNGLGKGTTDDVFLIDEDFNIRYIDKKEKGYGDNVQRTLLKDETIIRFTNKKFSEYISKISGAKEEDIQFQWMKNQTSLTIESDANIDSLEDLVFFPNLTSLVIKYSINTLKSLSGVEYCKKLTRLRLFAVATKVNGVSPSAEYSFEPLSTLTELKSLELISMAVSDKNWDSLIENISGLSNLEGLHCGGSGQAVWLSSIKGIGRLKQLKEFSLFCYNISELPNELNNLTNLERLVIYYPKIKTIENINKLKNLKRLDICSTEISEIKGLDNLINLETLNLISNKITQIEGLDNLRNLKTLDLSKNQITDITPLYKNTNLMNLNIKGNTGIQGDRTNYTSEQLEKIDKIGEILDRGGTIDVDVDKVGLFNGYTSLNLSYQRLTDLSILEGKTKLTTLYLQNNQITLNDEKSRKILESLTGLNSLSLDNNNLTDISAINKLSNLTSLTIAGENNNVDLKQIEDRISALNSFACNEKTFATITNCSPDKITKILFTWHGFSGALPNDLSGLTSLTNLSFPQCTITNLSPLSNISSLESLGLGGTFGGLHDRLSELNFTNLKHLTKLDLTSNGLWDTDLNNLLPLKDNKNLTLNLGNNSIIDARVLLQFNTTCKINLNNNVNLSQESKDELKNKFGNNVSF